MSGIGEEKLDYGEDAEDDEDAEEDVVELDLESIEADAEVEVVDLENEAFLASLFSSEDKVDDQQAQQMQLYGPMSPGVDSVAEFGSSVENSSFMSVLSPSDVPTRVAVELPQRSKQVLSTEDSNRRCYWPYHELPGFPKIEPWYPFLDPRKKLKRLHQLLHMCHYGTEEELMEKMEGLLDHVFIYKKVVIAARRDERVDDIEYNIKTNVGIDSLVIRGDAEYEDILDTFDKFRNTDRRILICNSIIHPETECLNDVDLVIYWNVPWTGEHLGWMLERLKTKALILLFIKQDGDRNFLVNRKEDGLVFPELDLESDDPQYAGLLNQKFQSEGRIEE